jgi:hypothetical protein
MLVELIKLILKHGAYTSRVVVTAAQVDTAVAEWQPHLVVLDTDLNGTQIVALLGARTAGRRLPVIGLTRGSEGQARRDRGRRGRHPDDLCQLPGCAGARRRRTDGQGLRQPPGTQSVRDQPGKLTLQVQQLRCGPLGQRRG